MIDGNIIPHTGRTLAQTRPEVFNAVVLALASGETPRSIARRLGVDDHTVSGIREHHPDLVKAAQALQAKAFMELSRLSAETAKDRLLESPDKVNFKDLVLGAAIAVDKAMLLTGQATERVEVRVSVDADELDDILKHAKRADVIDVKSTSHNNLTQEPPRPSGPENLISTKSVEISGIDDEDYPQDKR